MQQYASAKIIIVYCKNNNFTIFFFATCICYWYIPLIVYLLFDSGRGAAVSQPGTAVGGLGGRAWRRGAWAPVPTAAWSGTSCREQARAYIHMKEGGISFNKAEQSYYTYK